MFWPKSNRSKRWDAIRQTMGEWRMSRPEPKTYNNSLRGYIKVSTHSERETAYWGSRNPENTAIICNHFNEVLRYAVKKGEVEPHPGAAAKFSKLIILEREIKGVGTAKLTVGVKPDGEMVQYCITAGQGVEGAMAIA